MKSIQQVNSELESTLLNGTTDSSVKQPKSANKKKTAKSAAPIGSMNPTDTVADANTVNCVQSPQLFTDEIGISEETNSAIQSDESVATDTPDATKSSDVADTLIQSDKHKSTDVSAEPSDTDLSEVPIESTATAEPITADSTDVIITPSATIATTQPDTSSASDEARVTRVSRKQSREELDDYKTQYLAPFKIGKRHAVVLDDDLWNELDYIVRRIGDSKANATAYANAIISNHLNEIRQKVETWRKL